MLLHKGLKPCIFVYEKKKTMTYPKIFSIIFILSLFILTSCDKDDDSETVSEKPFGSGFVTGEKGSDFEIIKNGVKESCVGDNVIGWVGGQLLGSNYYKQIMAGCDDYWFALRINIPQGTLFEPIAERKHDLYATHLLLQNTQYLDTVLVEFYQNTYNPPIKDNSSGTVEIQRDVTISGQKYSVVGYVDAHFYNNGDITTVKGYFWSKDASWD